MIKKYYLVNKSVNDLLNKRFVNHKGKRYASNRSYERKLRDIISDMSDTDIDKLLTQRQEIGNKIHEFVDDVKPINYLAIRTTTDYYFNISLGK